MFLWCWLHLETLQGQLSLLCCPPHASTRVIWTKPGLVEDFKQAVMCLYLLRLTKSCLGGAGEERCPKATSPFASREFVAQLSICHCNLAGNQPSVPRRFPSFNCWRFCFSTTPLQQQWWQWITHQSSPPDRVSSEWVGLFAGDQGSDF